MLRQVDVDVPKFADSEGPLKGLFNA